MTHYILNSSIATHVLDGDLWSRKPATIVRYHTELHYSHFLMEQWVDKDSIKLAVAALKWAQDVGGWHQTLDHPDCEKRAFLRPTGTIRAILVLKL